MTLPTTSAAIAAGTPADHAGWHNQIHTALAVLGLPTNRSAATTSGHVTDHEAIHGFIGLASLPPDLTADVSTDHYGDHVVIHAYVNGTIPATNRYGIAWGSGTPTTADYNAMQAAGVQWLRVDADLGGIYTTSTLSSGNYTRFDGIVSACNARNMKVLPMMGYTPAWARPGGTDDKCPPTSNTNYQNMCDAFAARYFSQGVTVYELWNEPNLGQFWKPGGTAGATAAGYSALLAAGSVGIKNGRAARVVTAGLAPANTGGSDIDPRTFLSGIYTAGVASSFDAVGVHPYYWDATMVSATANQSWMTWTRAFGGSSVGTNNMRQIMVNNGDSAKPMWATEWGGPTDVWTESFQSSEVGVVYPLFKGYTFTTASWGNAPLFTYQWRDQNTAEAAGNHEMHFGLEHTDGSDKAAMAQFITEAARS